MSGRADSRKARGALLFAVVQVLSVAVVTATTLFLSSGLAAAQTDIARLLHDPNVCWVREIDLDQGPSGDYVRLAIDTEVFHGGNPALNRYLSGSFHTEVDQDYIYPDPRTEHLGHFTRLRRVPCEYSNQQLFRISVWWSDWIAVSEQCRDQLRPTHRLSAVLHA